MSLFRTLLGGEGLETKTIDASALTWSALLAGAFSSKSGVPVSTETALQIATVFACCRVLAEGVAQIPLDVAREDDNGKRQKMREHPLHRVLTYKPNAWMTPFEWRETSMYHAVLSKGACSQVSRVGRPKEIRELLPFVPSMVSVLRDWKWEVAVQVADGLGQQKTFDRSEVFMMGGPTWDGVHRLEVVQQARETFGLAIAAEEAQARLHSNGARPSGLITTDQALTDDALDRIKTQLQAYSGVANTGKIPVLDIGLKFQPMRMTGMDAETMAIRREQVNQICSVFRVHPQMIGAMDKAPTYASAEQFFIAHLVHTLGPWLRRWEEAIQHDLFTEEEVAQGYVAAFRVQELMRGDAKTRAEYLASGIVNGWMTRNEARRGEYLPPLDGLDEPLVPLNMGTESDRKAMADAAADPVKNDQKVLAEAIVERLGLQPKLEGKVRRLLSARHERRIDEARDLIGEMVQQSREEGFREAA